MKELEYRRGCELYPDKTKNLLPDKIKGKRYYHGKKQKRA